MPLHFMGPTVGTAFAAVACTHALKTPKQNYKKKTEGKGTEGQEPIAHVVF